MPTISLRLTEEQHLALKEWAHGAHRSMQREAIFRIFQEHEREPVVELDRSVAIPESYFPTFKPDFKK